MASVPVQQRSTAAEWEPYKELIRKLYLEEDRKLKGPDGVSSLMRSRHGFDRTPAQYGRRLKQWSFKKNRTKDEWIQISNAVRKRKHAGKDSEVVVHGLPLSTKKLKKELSRYDIGNLHDTTIHHQESSAQSMIVRTPPSFEPELAIETVGSMKLNKTNGWRLPPTLSFLKNAFQDPARLSSFYTSFHSTLQQVRCLSKTLSISLPDRLLASSSKSIPASALLKTIPRMAKMILPPSVSVSSQICLGYQQDDMPFMTTMIYAFTNGLLEDKDGFKDFQKGFLEHLQSPKGMKFISQLLASEGLARDALCDRLIRSAFVGGAEHVVERLLNAGIRPGDMMLRIKYPFIEHESLISPLQCACENCWVGVVRMLIDQANDIEYLRSSDLDLHAIPIRKGIMELLQLLKAHDADFKDPIEYEDAPECLLSRALCYESSEVNKIALIDFLVEAGMQIRHLDSETFSYLQKLSNRAHFDGCAATSSRCLSELIMSPFLANSDLEPSLNYAIDDRNGRLVQFLLENGAEVSETIMVELVTMYRDPAFLEILAAFRDSQPARLDKDTPEHREPPNKLHKALENWICHCDLKRLKSIRPAEVAMEFISKIEDIQSRKGFLELLFYHAVKADDEGTLEMVLKADLDASLIAAAGCHDAELLDKVLALGARSNRNLTFFSGAEAFKACLKQIGGAQEPDIVCEPIVRRLVQAGADPTLILHGAITRKMCHCVEVMIQSPKAQLNHAESFRRGLTPLAAAAAAAAAAVAASQNVFASRTWAKNLVDTLLGLGSDPRDTVALAHAATNPDTQVLEKILAAVMKFETCGMRFGWLALQIAIGGVLCTGASKLLASGVPVNYIPIMTRNSRRSENVISKYLDEKGRLDEVIAPCDCKIRGLFMRRLTGCGAEPETAFGSALRHVDLGRATEEGDVSTKRTTLEERNLIDKILDAGGDPHGFCYHGLESNERRTPLVHAILNHNHYGVEALLRAGADPNENIRSRHQKTPLQQAAAVGNVEMVERLLKLGADVNAGPSDEYGATALQFAAVYGCADIVSILIDAGADVNAKAGRIDGRTAIEGAAEQGRFDTVDLLIQRGAIFIGSGSSQYEAAIKRARDNGFRAVCRLLEEARQDQLRDLGEQANDEDAPQQGPAEGRHIDHSILDADAPPDSRLAEPGETMDFDFPEPVEEPLMYGDNLSSFNEFSGIDHSTRHIDHSMLDGDVPPNSRLAELGETMDFDISGSVQELFMYGDFWSGSNEFGG